MTADAKLLILQIPSTRVPKADYLGTGNEVMSHISIGDGYQHNIGPLAWDSSPNMWSIPQQTQPLEGVSIENVARNSQPDGSNYILELAEGTYSSCPSDYVRYETWPPQSNTTAYGELLGSWNDYTSYENVSAMKLQ